MSTRKKSKEDILFTPYLPRNTLILNYTSSTSLGEVVKTLRIEEGIYNNPYFIDMPGDFPSCQLFEKTEFHFCLFKK